MSEQRGARQEREREKITVADTEKHNLNSEMTGQVKISSVTTAVSPTAEDTREGERENVRECCNANVKRVYS